MAALYATVGTAVLGKVTELVVEPFLKLIWKPITWVLKWESNVKSLKQKVQKLEAEKKRVLEFVEAAGRGWEEAGLNVKNWLTGANEFIAEMEKLGDDEDKAKKCFSGVCPNPNARYQISKKVEKYLEDVAQLLAEAAGFKIPDTLPAPPQGIFAAQVTDFGHFSSRESVLNGIMKALRSASVDKIGVYGMPGVGKTMLAREVARQAEEAHLFDVVVMASVKKENPDLKRIQEEIAVQLGLQLRWQTEFGIACQLKAYLKTKKRILVILDDIWSSLNLDELGIPFEDQKYEASSIGEEQMQCNQRLVGLSRRDSVPFKQDLKLESCEWEKQTLGEFSSSGGSAPLDSRLVKSQYSFRISGDPVPKKEQMQCKVLFTSRSQDVLSCDMGTHENFEVGLLADEEAWELLKKIVGPEIEKSGLQSTAMEIAKKCSGLPLAVEPIGKALRGKSPHVWNDALLQLKRPSLENFKGISASVYTAIELSYKHLEREELQKIFLLCSLLGHDASIEDLMAYGMGLDLFCNVKTTGEARNRVRKLVDDLKACSLLLDGSSNIHFDMHEIVRDVAILIALRDHHALSVLDDCIPQEWADREALQDFKWISLQYADISLPNELVCPQLALFCLYSKDPSMKIQERLFQGMPKLKVLSFTKMHLSSLPSSICLLKHLHTLRVKDCILKDVTIIGKLVSLKVLSLSGCDIEELPVEIEELTQLKLLDLSDCTKLKVIRPHVLASLSRLEELYLRNSFNQWHTGEEDVDQSNASLVELKGLHNLVALDVHICDVQFIPEDLFFERLERYKIFIGEVWNCWDSSFQSSKILKLELNTSFSFNYSIGMLMRKTAELHLRQLKGIKNAVYELDVDGFQELKSLYVQSAPELQHIINSNSVKCAFPMLEELFLRDLNSLVKICHDRLGAASFSRLTIIAVEFCNQLQNLFPFCVARRLLRLKEIRVTECRNLEEIVDEEGQGGMEIAEANAKFELVQLRSLKLQYLPKFSRIRVGIEETSSNPAPLFHEKILFPNLEELQLSWINIKGIRGSQLWVASCIQNLTKLIIEGCDHLENFLSSSTAKSLMQLKQLEIRTCKRMREIIEPENEKRMEDFISFPNLKILQIEHLENLTMFCSGNCRVEFTSLQRLRINKCPKLKGFTVNHTSTDTTDGLESLFNEKVAFPSLEDLYIYQSSILRIIGHHQPPADSFCKLKSLEIVACDKLSTIVPSHILGRLCTSLERLYVSLCGGVEEIFELDKLNVEESHAIIDTQLRDLFIHYLPRLKHVWTKDPRRLLSFQNLKSLIAVGCPNLKTMFPASMAMSFQQLEVLKLIECGIEEVVTFKVGDETVPRFLFSSLYTLVLRDLFRLKCFYSQKHVIEWPMLKKFNACHCERSVKDTNGESLDKFPVQLPLFSLKKVIPRLEKLSLTSDDIAMLRNRQIPEDLFSNVKVLKVSCYHDLTAVFPFFFLERFCNLQKLQIRCSNFKDLLPSRKNRYVGRHLPIRKLKLDLLFQLKYIWSKDSGLDLLLQHIESLEVLRCNSLISLSESTASFQNLTTLMVARCQGFRNLFSFATAQSLVQLQTMTIDNCHLLTEIVEDEGEGEDVIVFSKLKVLRLLFLTRLTSFCSGKFIIKFPLLEQVAVIQCPNLEIFCHGVLNTPMLQRIQFSQEDGVLHPVFELNNTINQRNKEKVGYAELEHLKLSEIPGFLEIWNKNPQEVFDFRQLCTLEICDCGSLRYLLTSSMTLNLVCLQTLNVQNCEMMEQIITEEEEEAMEVAKNKIIFPLLNGLNLESCSNLASFFVGSCKLECLSLSKINIVDCPKMATFVSTISSVQVKEASDEGSEERICKEDINIPAEPFFGDQVEFSSFLYLNLSSMKTQQIFHHLPASSVVQSVGFLTLRGCDNLKYLFTSSMIKSFVQLKSLTIHDCEMMKEVIVTEGSEEEETKVFLNLRILRLEDLPELTRFCSGNYFLFPLLTHLCILECPLLETFIFDSTVGEMSHMTASKNGKYTYGSTFFNEKVAFPSLEYLLLKDMESLKKIWDNQLDADSFHKLDYFEVAECEELLNIFPITMLGRLQNLDKLQIIDCASLVEIFEPLWLSASESQTLKSSQSTLVEAVPNLVFSKVTELVLLDLPNLKSVYHQIHTIEWPSLEKLVVSKCNQVEILASELMRYQRTSRENQLEIQNQCSLFWLSKGTFPSLEELKVDCNYNMMEIWHCDDVKDVIVFPKLESLQLSFLPRLASFCSGDCTFQFLSLEDVLVEECPDMMTFCRGEISTPKLHKVKLVEAEDEGFWEGGLNRTIKLLFRNMSDDDSEEDWSDALVYRNLDQSGDDFEDDWFDALYKLFELDDGSDDCMGLS